MSVRLPGLLLPNLTEKARLRPTAGSLTVKMVGSSEAVLTLPEDEADIQIHDWVSVYTEEGPAGLFRVTNVAQPLKKQVDVTLLHGIDILSDSVWAEQTEFSGTKEAFLRALLNQQTQLINGQRPWVLGVCEDTATVRRDINYDRLSTLLEGLNEDGGNYWFTYDMSGFPWVLNYVRVDDTVVSEFRLTRNIRSATVTYNDADLCTRLFLTVSTKTEETVPTKKMNPAYVSDQATPNVPRIITENITVSSVDSRIKQYNNTAAQGDWGIVVKTADIDTTDDILNGHFESADAWAAAFMARRSAPSVQIQIDGDDLFALTGDTWDRTKVGRLCQVALPAYGKAFRERVVSVTYPELFKKPDEMPRPTHVTVSLSNILPRFSESLAQAEKEAASASRSSRSTARAQTKDEKELTTWSQHVQWQGAALDGSGIMTLYESGIDMDATGGVKIYSLENGLQGLYGELVVQARKIAGKVGSDALNGYLKITDLTTEMGNVMEGANGKTVAAKIVTAINAREGTGVVKIEADQVDITGLVTMTQLEAVEGKIDTVRAETITAGTYLSAATGKFNTLWVESPGSNGATHTAQVNNAVNGLYEYTPAEEGKIGFQYTTLANPTKQSINFNIADTAYFKSHVGIDAANLTLTEIGQTPYNASTAAEITGITAGTSDKYFLIAASPKTGDAVYKKFVLPAASAPPVVASIDDITGTTLAANQIADTNITITASGTNVSAYSESVALEESTYQVGSITRPCVVLKVDGNVVGRIYTQNAYQAGQSAGVASASITNLSGVTLATNQIKDAAIPITASGTNVSDYSENVSMEESTYQVGSTTRPCVVLKVDGNVVGRIYTQNAYQAGQSAGASSAAGSITNLSGTAIATNQIMDSAIPITASGTNVSNYTENVSMEESTYQVGSTTRPCVVLKVDGNVVGRIYTQNAYQAGQSAGASSAAGSITNLSGTAIATNQIKDTAIPITASGTNVSSYSENVSMEESTYQVGSTTRPCVVLKVDGAVVGRIYTQNAYQAGQSAGASSAAGSITNLSGTAIATNQIKDAAIPITASGTNVSSYSENVSLEESTYQVGSVTRPCVVLKVDGSVVGRIYTQNAYQAGVSAGQGAAAASIDDIAGTAIDATVLKASVPVTASGTNVSSRTENAVLARATYQVGSANNHCVTLSMDNTVIGRISTQSVFIDGRDSVTITHVERIASCAFDPDARTARQDVRFTLSNGSTYTLHENFDAIYRAGLAGTSVDTTIEYAADLSSEGVVFDADVDEDAQGNPLRINLSDIYQRGVTDAIPPETHWYVTGSGATVPIYYYVPIIGDQGVPMQSTKVAFYTYTPVEIVGVLSGNLAGYTQVSYNGTKYIVLSSNLTESEEDLSIGHRIGIKNLQEVITVTSRTMTGLIHTGGCTSNISVYLEPRYGNTGNFTSSYVSSSDFSSYRANGSASDYFYEMATMANYYGRHEKTAFGSDIQHKAVFHIIYSNNDEEDVVVSFSSYAKAQDEVIYDKTGYIDANNYVNLRSTNSTGGSILIQVPDGAAVMCKFNPNGYNDSWMPVQYGGKTGYIQSQYIEGTNAWKELNTKKVKTITLVGVAHAVGSSRKDFTVMINTMTGALRAVTSYATESSDYAYNWAVTNNDPETYLNHVAGSDYLYHRKSDCSSRILMRVKLNVTYTNPSKFPAETIVLSVYSAAK